MLFIVSNKKSWEGKLREEIILLLNRTLPLFTGPCGLRTVLGPEAVAQV